MARASYCGPLLGIARYFCHARSVTDWHAIAVAVRDRRESLGLTQSEAVAASGGMLSIAVWNSIENERQEDYRKRSLRGVARALRWPDDALERIGAGGDPADLEESITASSVLGPVAAAILADTALDDVGRSILLDTYDTLVRNRGDHRQSGT